MSLRSSRSALVLRRILYISSADGFGACTCAGPKVFLRGGGARRDFASLRISWTISEDCGRVMAADMAVEHFRRELIDALYRLLSGRVGDENVESPKLSDSLLHHLLAVVLVPDVAGE